ncbi:uncharacterized protein PAC_02094 [Phialocephala subalpina]|uniref:Major facilitator superfamily (MFS) profile domain-containing protein n=1 Tax=Phialocephala subalpina TaxID=576137 RepID=A0A1L7WHJ6_9HELO|nr:uncharacterized protein PAC_02094 [Phialocephala subalpina]
MFPPFYKVVEKRAAARSRQHPYACEARISQDEDTLAIEPPSRVALEAPYTIFSRMKTILLVALASMSTCLGPLAANIYYPAIIYLSYAFNVPTNFINLTITVYLVFQCLAPTFVGSISDAIGRCLAYIICFIIYLAADLGLALQDNYAGLMVLRCLQSTDSSGTVALANAVVADIATSSERVIGRLLDQCFGWRSIFWFLVIMSGTLFLILLAIIPETCRAVVCDGSIPPQKWNISLLTYLPAGFSDPILELQSPRNPAPQDGPSTSSAPFRRTTSRSSLLRKPGYKWSFPLSVLGSINIVAYGWALQIQAISTALPVSLILLYFLGFNVSGAFNAFSTLIVDLHPESPGTATVAANLVRCLMGAGTVAGISPLLNNIGTGWANVVRRIRDANMAEAKEGRERIGDLESGGGVSEGTETREKGRAADMRGTKA